MASRFNTSRDRTCHRDSDRTNSDRAIGCPLSRGVRKSTDWHSQVYQSLSMSECNLLVRNEKISPKRKFLGRTSRGHPGVIRADIPAQNFGQGGQNPEKNMRFGADIYEPKARTSTTLRGFQKLRSEKLWAEFSLLRAQRVFFF